MCAARVATQVSKLRGERKRNRTAEAVTAPALHAAKKVKKNKKKREKRKERVEVSRGTRRRV